MNYLTSTLSSKYQLTMPWEVREDLKIDSKDFEIVWIKLPSGSYMVKARKILGKNENPFLRVCGILKSDGTVVDEFIKEKRKEAKRDNK